MVKNRPVIYESSRISKNQRTNEITRTITGTISFEAPVTKVEKAVTQCIKVFEKNHKKSSKRKVEMIVKGVLEYCIVEKI